MIYRMNLIFYEEFLNLFLKIKEYFLNKSKLN